MADAPSCDGSAMVDPEPGAGHHADRADILVAPSARSG
jgi:hypothetical protein